MFFGDKRRIVSLVLASCLLFTAELNVFAAGPQSEAHISTVSYYENVEAPFAGIMEQTPELAKTAVSTKEWYGKALANTDTTLDVYDTIEGAVNGKLYKNTVVTIVEEGETWSKISSGKLVGYVQNSKLLFGSAAVERAKTVCAQGTKDGKTVAELEAEKKKESDVKILAALIYCEAGNQSYTGKVAVGSVVMNRINSSRFPNSLNGVVYQRGQFTPAMTGKLARVLSSGHIPSSCYDAAREAMEGAKPVGNALFFNTSRGNTKLGDHYFS